MHNIDLVGSFVVGGLLLLALVGLTAYFNMSAHSNNISQVEQRNLTEFGRVIEYDFNKIGYRVTSGDTIVAMDSTYIRFRADIDNNGTADSVSYIRSGQRPDFTLTRHTSLAPRSDFSFKVKDFSLRGYTASGALTYSKTQVHSIEFRILLEKEVRLPQQVDKHGGYWTRKFYPKNL
ncbi:MAG TPA: hypothetical protein PLG50_11565 [bacterium]|nr:hypothetical protein [bacterium]HQG46286.1 hypothetical protein [bacterium]HQI49488.1 hypothetical protein [bacterium]HQJ64840.1 hypothetical protein [bacterium]